VLLCQLDNAVTSTDVPTRAVNRPSARASVCDATFGVKTAPSVRDIAREYLWPKTAGQNERGRINNSDGGTTAELWFIPPIWMHEANG